MDGRLLPASGEAKNGNPADAASRTDAPDAGRRAAVHLDDRPARADDLFLDAALQPARSRLGSVRRAGELPLLPYRSRVPRVAPEHAGAGRLGAGADRPARNSAGAAARPAGDRPQHRAADGDRAVLRDADGERAGLEEPADAPGVRPVRLARQAGRIDTDRLVYRRAAARGDPDRGLAMVAVRDADPAHRAAIARR